MLRIDVNADVSRGLGKLDALKTRIATGLDKVAQVWAVQTVGVIKSDYLSGPRTKKRLGVVTGRLRSSIRSRVDNKPDTLVITFGTDVEYARIHELGGTTEPHIITPRKAGRVLSFMKGGKRVFARSVQHPGSDIKARPFIRPGVKGSIPEFKSAIGKFLEEVSNGNA